MSIFISNLYNIYIYTIVAILITYMLTSIFFNHIISTIQQEEVPKRDVNIGLCSAHEYVL